LGPLGPTPWDPKKKGKWGGGDYIELLIAFSTDDGENLNEDHFGMARYFRVYKFSDGREEFIETRNNVKYEEDESLKHGDPGKDEATSSAVGHADVIIGKKWGLI